MVLHIKEAKKKVSILPSFHLLVQMLQGGKRHNFESNCEI